MQRSLITSLFLFFFLQNTYANSSFENGELVSASDSGYYGFITNCNDDSCAFLVAGMYKPNLTRKPVFFIDKEIVKSKKQNLYSTKSTIMGLAELAKKQVRKNKINKRVACFRFQENQARCGIIKSCNDKNCIISERYYSVPIDEGTEELIEISLWQIIDRQVPKSELNFDTPSLEDYFFYNALKFEILKVKY